MEYNVDFFIEKFQAIPELRWWTGQYISNDGYAKCAMGHCGCVSGFDAEFNKEVSSLILLFGGFLGFNIHSINDGDNRAFPEATPKQRILSALHKIKEIQQGQMESQNMDITQSLASLPIVEERADVVGINSETVLG